ncbi:hypothetical protein M0813_08478 [Anaeramoeba flamelloides]|uniref:Uncharacterized protein n=1 Tax=Anaeramoeba flamelloides TaxID=1746091 RepID=A0ABQ8XBK7_9EUKA|nr:hypothetical protein M0813_08478 [Anaeramoeba flamelloides]
MYSITNQPKDTFRRRITRSTKQVKGQNSETNYNKIGIFHYSDVTLQDILEKAPKHMLYKLCFQFYVPIDSISYSNEKVINRRVWAANKSRYSSNTDLVPLIIHSSIYIPHNERKKKKKKKNSNVQDSTVGIMVSIQFLDVVSPKFLMKRKNGIRSRYCSKSFDKLVLIRDVNYLQSQSQVPTNFFDIADLPNYVNSVTPPNDEPQRNRWIEAMSNNVTPNLAIDFKLLNCNSKVNRKRKSQVVCACNKKAKKIVIKKRVKTNKNQQPLNKPNIVENMLKKQTKVKTTIKKETRTKRESQIQNQKKNKIKPKQNADPKNDKKIKIIDTLNNFSLRKEQFPNDDKNKTLLSEDFLKLHCNLSLNTSVETTYLPSINYDFWDTLKIPTFDFDENVVSPIEQYQFSFNNHFLPLKNDLVYEEILPYSYGYDSTFIY